jgi:hypothetical protein
MTGIIRSLEIPVSVEQLDAWQAGSNIQDAMPELDATLREFVMTGITAEEWDELPEL